MDSDEIKERFDKDDGEYRLNERGEVEKWEGVNWAGTGERIAEDGTTQEWDIVNWKDKT